MERRRIVLQRQGGGLADEEMEMQRALQMSMGAGVEGTAGSSSSGGQFRDPQFVNQVCIRKNYLNSKAFSCRTKYNIFFHNGRFSSLGPFLELIPMIQ